MRIESLKVAVTGGAGFIGSHLVDLLVARRNRVVVLDNLATGRRENIECHLKSGQATLHDVDVCNAAATARALAGTEVVFHLATNCVRLSLVDPATNHAVNATGTLNALMGAREGGAKRFVYCSSSEVYGDIAALRRASGGGDAVTLDENSPMRPTTVYGASKLVGEHYTLAYHQTYGLPGVVARPFNAYGPRSHFAGPYGEVIPRFAIWLKAGLEPVIFGDGQQTRDFTYVEDTAHGLLAAAECDALLGDSVNLAHGEEVSVRRVVEILGELLGVGYRARHVEDRPGDIRRLGANVAKATRMLRAPAKTEIREGIRKYLAWLESQNLDFKKLAQDLVVKNWVARPGMAGGAERK